MEGQDKSEREGGTSVAEMGSEEVKEAVQVTEERLNQVGKKGREEARAKAGAGEGSMEEEAVAEVELEEMGSVRTPDIVQRGEKQSREKKITRENVNRQRKNRRGSELQIRERQQRRQKYAQWFER